MTTTCRYSGFLPLEDDSELDDVFELAPSTVSDLCEKRHREATEAPGKYTNGKMADSATDGVRHGGSDCRELVTLHSLSGHQLPTVGTKVPSPPSVHSFTFSSDEDEPADSPMRSHLGITPPIAIPRSSTRPGPWRQLNHVPNSCFLEASPETVWDSTPLKRGRAKSCPEALLPSTISRLQVPCRLVTPLPTQGHTCSRQARDHDGLPLHAPHSACSMSGARDLTLQDVGAFGHQHRVLVLPLPDVIVDSERETADPNTLMPATTLARPSRQRAFSCEVTFAEEIGKKLRWIADSFDAKAQSLPDTTRNTRDTGMFANCKCQLEGSSWVHPQAPAVLINPITCTMVSL